MEKLFEFTATIQGEETGKGGAWIEIPFDVETVYNTSGQVKVVATFDSIEYRGSLAKMGRPKHFLLVRKDIRAKINKEVGDVVEVTLKKDTEAREVNLPEVLVHMLDRDHELKKFFESLSYTNRKEYARWIADAKREDTKVKRLEETRKRLENKIKNPFERI